MNLNLKSKIAAVLGGGAIAIATVMLSGKGGLEGREYTAYRDVVGVITVCDGHTGSDIVWGKRYTDTGSSYMAGAQGTFVNLNAIVNSLRSSHPGVRIILIAPPYAPTDSAYGSSDEIARAVRRAARVLECGFIDQYSATLEVEMQGESWLSDGLHPNDNGYRVMFKNLQSAIVSAGSR